MTTGRINQVTILNGALHTASAAAAHRELLEWSQNITVIGADPERDARPRGSHEHGATAKTYGHSIAPTEFLKEWSASE